MLDLVSSARQKEQRSDSPNNPNYWTIVLASNCIRTVRCHSPMMCLARIMYTRVDLGLRNSTFVNMAPKHKTL